MDTALVKFFRQSVLSFKALYGYMDMKTYILLKLINPIFQLIFFTMLSKYVYNSLDITPFIISNAFILSANSAFFGVSFVMVDERRFGTLKSVIASTTNKFSVFLGRAFVYIVEASITVVIGIGAGIIFFGIHLSSDYILILSFCILISMFSAMGFGLLVGVSGMIVQDLNLLMNLCFYILLLLSGALFPVTQLPIPLQFISKLLPLTSGIEASKLIINGLINTQLYSLLLFEMLKGLLYFVMGYFVVFYIEKFAKYKGTLDL